MGKRYVQRKDWLGRNVFYETSDSGLGCGCVVIGLLIVYILQPVFWLIYKVWPFLLLIILGVLIASILDDFNKKRAEKKSEQSHHETNANNNTNTSSNALHEYLTLKYNYGKNEKISQLASLLTDVMNQRQSHQSSVDNFQISPLSDVEVDVSRNNLKTLEMHVDKNTEKASPNDYLDTEEEYVAKIAENLNNYTIQKTQNDSSQRNHEANYQKANMDLWRRNRLESGTKVQATGRIVEVYEDIDKTVLIMHVDDHYEQKLYGSLPSKVFQRNILLEDDWVTFYGISRGRTTSDMPYADYFPMPAMEVVDYEYHEKAPGIDSIWD